MDGETERRKRWLKEKGITKKSIATTTRFLSKRNGELIVTLRVVKRLSLDVYIRATEKSLTMSAPTVLGDSRTYQLVSLVVTQIVLGNHPVVK